MFKDKGGEFIATSREVPETLTSGATEKEALQSMSDALGAALADNVLGQRRYSLALHPQARRISGSGGGAGSRQDRLAILHARSEGVSNAALARRLHVSEGAIRRLMDMDHASRMDGVIAALAALGAGIIIEDQRQTMVAA
ncbi:MAG: type II toxin-antitoxin system HicB family antitoxin [Acidithiobacillus sp.]